jgi:SWI/SNF-related matrix-associated actin-dependent regulator of chromatin subfamily A3
MVGSGEEVKLVREPDNQYDKNAIRVLNIGGIQIGHVPRNVVSKLAPLLDRHLVNVEGVVHEGNRTIPFSAFSPCKANEILVGGGKVYQLSM